jgi:hypothetical protein
MHLLAGHSRATLLCAVGIADCQVLADSPIGTGDGESPTTGAWRVQQKGNLS